MSAPHPTYGAMPNPLSNQGTGGYGTQSSDFAQTHPSALAPSSQPGAFHEDFDASQRGSSIAGDAYPRRDRSASTASTAVQTSAPARSNTLKKNRSVRRSASTKSLKKSSSKRSLRAGSIGGVDAGRSDEDYNSAFYTPIPTQSSPTEVLANRFQAWRQLLKSLIAYFREISSSYDARAKAVHKVQGAIAAVTNPSIFMSENGLGDATRILDDYHKRSVAEANKSRDIENDVIGALTGLRGDLGQKIKEIKSLSGDFKNSVEKEKEVTRREVDKLQEALQHADHEDGSATGKNDPYVVRLGVDRSIERQIDEENYLHRAYLNLENSGRELEAIVVGEIQKAYNALASILKREGDDAYHVVESLRAGPIAIPKDQEWMDFVTNDPHFIDPSAPLRRIEDIEYPGKHHPAAVEVRAGMLERKSKYLKSYTAGWYVLSPTHLHEFKSADKLYSQPPVMSLVLSDQKLGSKSEMGSSSNKFMLKGKQSGGMHKGHNWVFRAETHETMLAWYEDIRTLTEGTSEQRNAFVRKHARSVSGMSDREGTISSDGMEDDEADAAPYSADAASLAEQNPTPQQRFLRPQPGGRFPSDMQVPRAAPLSPSSGSSDPDRDVIAAAGAIPGSSLQGYDKDERDPFRLDGVASGSRNTSAEYPGPGAYADQAAVAVPAPQQREIAPTQPRETPIHNPNPPFPQAPPVTQEPYRPQPQYEPEQPYQPQQQSAYPTITTAPTQTQTFSLPVQQAQPVNQQQAPPVPQQQAAPAFLGARPANSSPERPATTYSDWMTPAAAGVAGLGAGALGAEAYRRHEERDKPAAAPAPAAPVLASAPKPESQEQPRAFVPTGYEARWSQPYRDDSTAGPSAPAAVASPAAPVTSMPDVSSAAEAAEPMAASSGGTGSGLGGLESEGAHETGRFPTIVRHNTDMSISALHVPGEYPSGKRG